MTPGEAAVLLAHVAAFDRRTVGEADALAWHAALDDLPLDLCQQAVVAHYREHTDWLMPAHVRRWVTGEQRRRAGQARAQQVALPAPGGELRPAPPWARELYRQARTAQRGGPPAPLGDLLPDTDDGGGFA